MSGTILISLLCVGIAIYCTLHDHCQSSRGHFVWQLGLFYAFLGFVFEYWNTDVLFLVLRCVCATGVYTLVFEAYCILMQWQLPQIKKRPTKGGRRNSMFEDEFGTDAAKHVFASCWQRWWWCLCSRLYSLAFCLYVGSMCMCMWSYTEWFEKAVGLCVGLAHILVYRPVWIRHLTTIVWSARLLSLFHAMCCCGVLWLCVLEAWK